MMLGIQIFLQLPTFLMATRAALSASSEDLRASFFVDKPLTECCIAFRTGSRICCRNDNFPPLLRWRVLRERLLCRLLLLGTISHNRTIQKHFNLKKGIYIPVSFTLSPWKLWRYTKYAQKKAFLNDIMCHSTALCLKSSQNEGNRYQEWHLLKLSICLALNQLPHILHKYRI